MGEAVASADDLRQIAKFNNVDFGSHGVTHANLALLAEAEARQELQNSKRSLESIVGREITALSFPYGSYGARELRLASETGYKVFFDSTPQRLVATVGEGLTGRVGVQRDRLGHRIQLEDMRSVSLGEDGRPPGKRRPLRGCASPTPTKESKSWLIDLPGRY